MWTAKWSGCNRPLVALFFQTFYFQLQSCACEAALTTKPIRALMMPDHLVGDHLLCLFPGALSRTKENVFFKISNFSRGHMAKKPRMRFLHKILDLTGSRISFTIEMSVRRTVQGILNILHQTHISKASIPLLSSASKAYISVQYRKTKKSK